MKPEPSRPSLSAVLAVGVVMLTASAIMHGELPPLGLPSSITHAFAWTLILANFVIIAIGMATPQRVGWMLYFVLSFIALVALGVATPLAALWYLPSLLQ